MSDFSNFIDLLKIPMLKNCHNVTDNAVRLIVQFRLRDLLIKSW